MNYMKLPQRIMFDYAQTFAAEQMPENFQITIGIYAADSQGLHCR